MSAVLHHPARTMSRRLPSTGAVPTAEQVRHMRILAADTQLQAAARVHVAARTWQTWELGTRSMPAGLAELYMAKTGIRPLPSQES